MEERIVKGIWIPIEIWKDKNLTWNEKILLLEIDSYTSNEKDCFISNEFISELLGINETNASKTISSLIKKGYIVKTRFDGRKRYVKADLSHATTLTCQERQPSRAHDIKYTDTGSIDNIISTNTITDKEREILKEKKYDDDIFVDEIYAMYPTKCPVRNISLGKSYKDKDRIRKLLKTYSKEDIKRVVKHEVDEKYNKSMMQNFSTFLNNFPDPNSLDEVAHKPATEMTLKEKFENFLVWLRTKRGERAMYAFRITIDDFREMLKAYPNSAEFCNGMLRITEQPLRPNEKLIDAFRRYHTKQQ